FGSYIMGAAVISPTTFVLGTLAGSLLYCGGWMIAGYLLGANYQAPLAFLQAHFSGGAVLVLAAVAAGLAVGHHFLGRLGLYRIASHFRRHHAVPQAAQIATR